MGLLETIGILNSRTRATVGAIFNLTFFGVFSKNRPPRKASLYFLSPEKLAGLF